MQKISVGIFRRDTYISPSRRLEPCRKVCERRVLEDFHVSLPSATTRPRVAVPGETNLSTQVTTDTAVA